jgi:Aerotolerance regulator N-terminal
MQFVFPSLAWGFLLVLVPLLVHLINLLRHRRQPWAAMEFLLESYRKHRKWVWLKQALLLLSRMAVMAVLVAMLAHWVSGSRLMALLGRNVTHHYVLLDDSYSMADESSGVSGYQNGLSAIAGLLRTVSDDRGLHQVTLLRWSRAGMGQSPTAEGKSTPNSSQNTPTNQAATSKAANAETKAATSVDSVADLLARTVPSDPQPLLERLNATTPTALELNCEGSLKLIQPLIQSAALEQTIVYVVSDFRKKDWSQPEAVKTALAQLTNQGAQIQLIDCVTAQHQNLTLVDIQPEQEVLASGVPTFVRVIVRNNGSAPARNIQVRLTAIDYGGADIAPKLQSPFSGEASELPSIVIDQIAPSETVTRQTQVLFSQAASQVVRAELPADSLSADNSAACVLRISDGQPVLLVDADPEQKTAFYLESVLNPGSSAKTGFLVPRQDVAYLRDCQPSELEKYSAIVLMNVGRLDARALSNLESYVAAGGGLAIIPGSKLTAIDYIAFSDIWYRDGKGLLPAKLLEPADLAPSGDEGSVDIIAENHPVFQSLLGLSNSPFQSVRVSRYIPVVTDSAGPQGLAMRPEARIAAKLRNNSPFMIDAPFGKGRVITLLTAFETSWSNWPQDPTFVVATLKMIGYLGSFRRDATNERVGTPIRLPLSSREYLPEVNILLPGVKSAQRIQLDVIAKDDGKSELSVSLEPDAGQQTEEFFRATTSSGVFEFWATRLQGERHAFNFAHNVSPIEGDLSKIESSELLQNLRPVTAKYRTAVSVNATSMAANLSSSTTTLMGLLLLLLLFEQFMAWSTSFHLPRATQRGGM